MKNGCLKNLTCKYNIHIFILNYLYCRYIGINSIFDKFVSNLIVYASHTLISLAWYYLFYKSGNQIDFLLFYFPYGIIILAFLFFGNRIIIGLLLSYISLLFILKNYNLYLPINNFFVISASQLLSVPLILFVLQKFNITVGAGEKYKLDKTNIYHVLLISFFSTILLGILLLLSSIFYKQQINMYTFIMGNFIGAIVLIISMKLIVNLLTRFKIST